MYLPVYIKGFFLFCLCVCMTTVPQTDNGMYSNIWMAYFLCEKAVDVVI